LAAAPSSHLRLYGYASALTSSSVIIRPPPRPTLFPYTTLFRSDGVSASNVNVVSGWSAALCTNCGPTASRTVVVQNPTTTVNGRSEEHTSELQSRENLVCRLLLEKEKRC